jgi:hypothetical protein
MTMMKIVWYVIWMHACYFLWSFYVLTYECTFTLWDHLRVSLCRVDWRRGRKNGKNQSPNLWCMSSWILNLNAMGRSYILLYLFWSCIWPRDQSLGVRPISLLTHLEAAISLEPSCKITTTQTKNWPYYPDALIHQNRLAVVFDLIYHVAEHVVCPKERNSTWHLPEDDLAARKWALVNYSLRYICVPREQFSCLIFF